MAQASNTDKSLALAKEAAKRADADPIKPIKVNKDWYVGAKANSAQEDAQLAKELEREVSGLVGGSGLTWQGFNSTVKTRIAPKMLSLARSAYAQVDKLPAGERGRAAFEKWDELTAGTVMRSILRLERVIASNTTERFAYADVLKNEAQFAREKSFREGWSYNANIQFTQPIYSYFLQKYSERSQQMPMLDPGFMTLVDRNNDGVDATTSNNTLWKEIPKPTTITRTKIVFGTPSQIAAYKFGASIGQGIGGAVLAWGEFKASIRQLDETIRNTRAKFWKCYSVRCKEASRLYQDYSTVLYWKDWHYLVRPSMIRRISQIVGDQHATSEMIFKMGGAEEVDGGMPSSCNSEQSAFEAEIQTILANWNGLSSSGDINIYPESVFAQPHNRHKILII